MRFARGRGAAHIRFFHIYEANFTADYTERQKPQPSSNPAESAQRQAEGKEIWKPESHTRNRQPCKFHGFLASRFLSAANLCHPLAYKRRLAKFCGCFRKRSNCAGTLSIPLP